MIQAKRGPTWVSNDHGEKDLLGHLYLRTTLFVGTALARRRSRVDRLHPSPAKVALSDPPLRADSQLSGLRFRQSRGGSSYQPCMTHQQP
jgi:hypothetical protein